MTTILCRVDNAGKPLVFVAETLKGDEIKMWKPGKTELETVGLGYYYATNPLNQNDAETLRSQYANKMHDKNVTVRARIPKRYKQYHMTPESIVQSNGKKESEQIMLEGKQERRASGERRETNKPDIDELAKKIAEILRPLM